MKTKIRFHKLTTWLLTLTMLMTFIPSFTFMAFASEHNSDSLTEDEAILSADSDLTKLYIDISAVVDMNKTVEVVYASFRDENYPIVSVSGPDTAKNARNIYSIDIEADAVDTNFQIFYTDGTSSDLYGHYPLETGKNLLIATSSTDCTWAVYGEGNDGQEIITIAMTDAYRDGWNGACIEIYEDGILYDTVTVPNGVKTNTYILPQNKSSEYTFIWKKGSYDKECSFTISLGDTVLTTVNGVAYNDGEVIHTIEASSEQTEYSITGNASENGTDGNKATATVFIPKAGTYTLIFTDYEETKLNKVDTITFTVTEDEVGIITVPSEIDITLGTNDKIMLWQDMTNLVPLCEAYMVE